jgi:hypothetical protein
MPQKTCLGSCHNYLLLFSGTVIIDLLHKSEEYERKIKCRS